MQGKTKIGLGSLGLGCLLPLIAYVGGHMYLANLASYGGPPNQGAMVLAYLAFVLSAVLGGVLVLGGLLLIILSQVYPKPKLPE
jgi:hypothetical protein